MNRPFITDNRLVCEIFEDMGQMYKLHCQLLITNASIVWTPLSMNGKIHTCYCHYILEFHGNKGRENCVGVGGPKALRRKFAGAWPNTKRWRHMIIPR